MHKDVKIMFELQRYWDKVLENRENIARAHKNIDFWKNDLLTLRKELSELETGIKNLKNDIKQNELELSELDEKVKKLKERKNTLQTEKELAAVDKELNTVTFDQEKKEEALIQLMDDLDEKEEKQAQLSAELSEKEIQVEKDIKMLENNIESFEKTITENQEQFDQKAEELSPSIKTRYIKLIHSKKDGKGVGEVSGEICGICHFQIPSSLAVDAAKNDKLVTCTNCGRYIYK